MQSRGEAKLRQLLKMEAIGQLTGGVAHDFNNLLAVVLGGLGLAKKRLEKGDTNIQTLLDGVTEGAQRAAALTKRLLAFSRQQPLEPRPVHCFALGIGLEEAAVECGQLFVRTASHRNPGDKRPK